MESLFRSTSHHKPTISWWPKCYVCGCMYDSLCTLENLICFYCEQQNTLLAALLVGWMK